MAFESDCAAKKNEPAFNVFLASRRPTTALEMTIILATAIEDFWTARARGEFFPKAYEAVV